MKKRAYTLAEILIALGIIGILAAIMTPMVNKYKPDTMKVLYLNTHDSLAEIISSAAENDDYYSKDNGVFLFDRYPFMNFESHNNIHEGANKLCRVIADNFNIIEDTTIVTQGNVTCQDNAASYNINDPDSFRTDFTNKNGVEFMISTNVTGPQLENNSYKTEIVIDVNGKANGENCTFNEDTCRKPDRFLFTVSADAEFLPTDRMGILYLETRSNLKYKDVREYSNNSQLMSDVDERLDKNTEEFQQFTMVHSPRYEEEQGEEEE